MNYDFDKIIVRENTNCLKYDYRQRYFNDPDVLPLWVADMDFSTPDFVIAAIKAKLADEIFGYTDHTDSFYLPIIEWMERRHQWAIKREWIGYTPGVVPALNMAVLTFTEPGDNIIIQTPVYFPFYSAARDHNRELRTNPLILKNGRYTMDLGHLQELIDTKTKMLILCSPHNPTGNVWKKEELQEMAEICVKHNILIVSDEIHADIIYTGHKHTPTASISEEISGNVLTLMAPSKTFNFAGLATSYFIAPNPKIYHKYKSTIDKLHLSMGNIFGNVALEAAYKYGDQWLTELITYLEGNIACVQKFINNELPVIEVIKPEATFLVWLDFRNTKIDYKEQRKLLINKAKLGLSEGFIFGNDGAGFQRMNIGCPRKVLEQALAQLKIALKNK